MNIERWEVRGSRGTSVCDTESEARSLAADRSRLYPDLGPFVVEKVEYVRADLHRGAVEEREAMYEALVAQLGSHKLAEIAFRRRLEARSSSGSD